jgi:uncharacterized membrane protein (DUF2068 family)
MTGLCAHKLPFSLKWSEASVYQSKNGSVKDGERENTVRAEGFKVSGVHRSGSQTWAHRSGRRMLLTMEATATKAATRRAKRSAWVTGVIVLQALWALTLLTSSVYLLVHTPRSPEHTATLRLVGIMFGVPGLIAATGWFGLWKQNLWGWWTSLMLDGAIAVVFIYAVVDDAGYGLLDWTLVSTALIATVVPVYLLFPAVRRFYCNTNSKESSV